MVINGGGLRTARIGQPAQDDGGGSKYATPCCTDITEGGAQ